jgi:hypothetical protein
MRLKINTFVSFFLILTLLLPSSSFVAAFPEEGMFTPDQIASLPLRQKGLKISPLELYNPNGTDISDAVIRLSIGCTGEFVSPQGLILTNHHCAFDALVAASSPGKDYGKDGFKADSMRDEMPAKDYSIFITNRVENVTSKITKGTENLSGETLANAIRTNIKTLQEAEQAKVPEGTTIRIQALNSGLYYFLYETVEIKDIRIVYAPPQMIGFFGGDPDNFEWSRHTGDFTFLRAYVAPDGKSAAYSPDNVPYKPKKHLTISLNGLKENDFVFVMGYPGSTTRYRESQAIEYAQTTNFPFLVKFLSAWSNGLRAVGETNEEKRIALQSEITSIDNGRKVYEGGIVALRRSNFVAQRRKEEEKFSIWIAGNAMRQAKYGEVLPALERLSKDFYVVGARDRLLRTFPSPAYAPVYRQILDAVAAIQNGQKPDDKKRAEIRAAYQTREPILEREMLKYFLEAASELPADQKFQAAEEIFGSKKGRERREMEEKFAKSIAEGTDFDTAEDIFALYEMSLADLRQKFPELIRLVEGHLEERNAYNVRLAKFSAEIDRYRLLYQQGMAEMNRGKTLYPDANSTLRFTYGNVRGYQPREAVIYTPFTTLKGVIEKDTGVFPFDVPEKLKKLQQDKDFGIYGVGDSVPVNFLATTDIIGGNSGSPVLNAYGEQVGIVFDGNFEGLGNDLFFAPSYNRTIAVDIRYVLFVTEKFGDAGWILKEMTIKGGAVRKKAAGSR